MPLSYPRGEQRNSIIYHDNTKRRSAFIVPTKIRDNSFIQTLQNMPVSHNIDAEPLISPSFQNRKRSYPFKSREKNAIAYCCCGSHNCKIKFVDYASEDSECESSYSHDSVSPVEKTVKPFILSSRTNMDRISIDSYDYLHEDSIRKGLKELKEIQ